MSGALLIAVKTKGGADVKTRKYEPEILANQKKN